MSKFIKLIMICPYSLWHFTDFPKNPEVKETQPESYLQ